MTKAASERDAASIGQEWNPSSSIALEDEDAPRRPIFEHIAHALQQPNSPEFALMTSFKRVTATRKAKRLLHQFNRSAQSNEFIASQRRRREAALRLPPLECGCRDTETILHQDTCLGDRS